MNVQLRDLKQNYKILLALGQTLPTSDLAIPLPLSTGNPLYDAALTDKLVMTSTLTEPEHLNRAWHLVQQSTLHEQQTLAKHAKGLLNDYKLLLALNAWQNGNETLTRQFLWALPWGWRFTFATVVIKPARHIFTGWRRSLRFRLIDEPNYPALRLLFRELLAKAPPVAILKYRRRIKEAAALQRFRFEGEREEAIHDLCFNNGRHIIPSENLEPIGTYLQARQALAQKGVQAFLEALSTSLHEIPITSYMGLLGNAGIRLTDSQQPHIEALRDYAIRCATAVESLLRLDEWGSWLTEEHVQTLAIKIRHTIINRGIDIPFFKVIKAFMKANQRVRKLVIKPLYLPLLHHFGRQIAGSLPTPGPLTYIQPGNVIHLMSFLLYTIISSAMPTRLFLLYEEGLEEIPPLDLEEVALHLADGKQEMEKWLLSKFGGAVGTYTYRYNYDHLVQIIQGLNPQAPLILDLPFADRLDVLSALLPFERVFNLNSPFGAPGEISLAYEYYSILLINTRKRRVGVWGRYSNKAAERWAEFLNRLYYFQILATDPTIGGDI